LGFVGGYSGLSRVVRGRENKGGESGKRRKLILCRYGRFARVAREEGEKEEWGAVPSGGSYQIRKPCLCWEKSDRDRSKIRKIGPLRQETETNCRLGQMVNSASWNSRFGGDDH